MLLSCFPATASMVDVEEPQDNFNIKLAREKWGKDNNGPPMDFDKQPDELHPCLAVGPNRNSPITPATCEN